MSSCPDSSQLKWSSWGDVVKNACDRPTHETVLARRLCVPLAVGVVAAMVLVMLQPPFACAPTSGMQQPQLSLARVACWAVLAAIATAVLTSTQLFRTG